MSVGVGNTNAASHQAATTSTGPVNYNINSNIQATYKQTFFQPTNFGNETSINVTRSVLVNDWEYVTVKDAVSIYSKEEAFNAFAYTLPLSLYQKVNYINLNMKYSTATNATHELSKDLVLTKTDAIYTFVIAPNSNKNVNASFDIVLGINNLVQSNAAIASFPFNVSGINFLPFFNFPMTKYDYSGGVLSFETNKRDLESNSSFTPQASVVGLTVNRVQNYATSAYVLQYSTMTHLPNFNYTAIQRDYPSRKNMQFIPAYTNQLATNFTYPVTFRYQVGQAPIMYSHVAVTITVDPWGYVDYEEKTTLTNLGVPGLYIGGAKSNIPVFVNSNQVQSISVYDQYSNLTGTTAKLWNGQNDYPTNVTLITIVSRSDVSSGANYTYDLHYSIPASVYMNETSGFFSPAFNVTLPAMSMFNWTNRQVDLTIKFPALATVRMPKQMWGVNVTNANMSLDAFGLSGEILKLQLNNFSSYNNIFETFQVSYPTVVGPFFPIFYDAFWFFLLGLAIIIVRVFYQKYSGIVEVPTGTESNIPFELMREFVTAYEEKTALRSRLSDLEKKRKNLRKVEFEQRAQTLRNKQLANDKKLISVTAELSKVGSTYREAIKNLELAEAERDQILSQISDLEDKKKQSRIRPEIYNKLKNEQNSRLNKAITKIERVLNDLRSLLREAK